MPDFVWAMLPTVGSLFLGVLMFGLQTSPDEAVSNLSKWLELLGIRAPKWLRPFAAYLVKYGNYWFAALIALSIVAWGYYLFERDRYAERQIIPALLGFAAEGEAIRSDWLVSGDDRQLAVRFNNWSGRVTNYIAETVDAGFAEKFRGARASGTGCPAVRSPQGCAHYREIDSKRQVLIQWIAAAQR